MSIGISFAGQSLLLEDPNGAVQKWLSDFLPIDDLQAVTSWQVSPWKSFLNPTINYPPVLRPKLNTWYRPVGASRWSFGLFLASTQIKDAILQQVSTANSGQTLRFEYPKGTARTWLGYLLPPRPVSADVSSDNGLWILPIVDERYYWQFRGCGDISIDDGSAWETLFATLATALDITLNVDSVPAAYGSPDPQEWNAASNSNPAVMLDAAAWSVGQRVVLQYLAAGGGAYYQKVYRSCSWATSLERRTYNFNQPTPGGAQQAGTLSISGLNLGAITPESVSVVFRKWANGITVEGESYTKTLAATTYAPQAYTVGATQVIQTTAYADFTTGGGVPDNQAACDALAEQIAYDFYRQVSWVQDSNYGGVGPWIETGWDNYVEFSMGRRRDDGSYECRTRIHSLPYNLGVQSLLHWTTGTHDYPDTIEGKLDGNLTPNGTATLSVWEGSPRADSGRNVTVTDRLNLWIPSGSWVICDKIEREWRVRENRRPIIGYTNAAHNSEATGTIKVFTGSTPGSETDTGTTIQAYNGFCSLGVDKRVICIPCENGYHIHVGKPS